MPATIDRETVQALLARGAQLVEVLDADDYQAEHLPGAVNLPLRRLTAAAVAHLDRNRPLITYCNDQQ